MGLSLQGYLNFVPITTLNENEPELPSVGVRGFAILPHAKEPVCVLRSRSTTQ